MDASEKQRLVLNKAQTVSVGMVVLDFSTNSRYGFCFGYLLK